MKYSSRLRLAYTCVLVLVGFIFKANSQDIYPSIFLTLTESNATNINSTKYQHLKRSAGVLYTSFDGKNQTCSCFLVNNTQQNKIPYIITAAHCLELIFRDLSKTYTAFFSFDYEMPHSTNRRDSDERKNKLIIGLWKAKFEILIYNTDVDIALIKLKKDTFKPELLENAFASGWDNTLGFTSLTI